jgi:antitoxin component of RelBE/YafQ-DinJ toxin-antitoxin module
MAGRFLLAKTIDEKKLPVDNFQEWQNYLGC